MSSEHKPTLDDVVEATLSSLVLQVGKQVTEDYAAKGGTYEGMSIRNARSLSQAKAILLDTLQAAKAEARDKWKSICGCPMCEHHTSAYALQKDRHDTQAA